ncbi:MAG: LacI family DNA-binding transcriptional regulator [Saccharofermentanales bacterium]
MSNGEKPVNIDEIARIANVSRATVSRVINGNPSVSKKTRLAVQQVINDLNYIPNAAARSLVSKKTNTIGVLVYNIMQPFWNGIFAGIEEYFSANDYSLILANSKSHLDIWDYKKEYKKNIKNLILRNVDGIIIALANDLDEEDIELLELSSTPYVIIQNNLKEHMAYSVNVDNITGAYNATRYLISLGHRRISHATGPIGSQISQDRVTGYLNAMKEAHISVDNSYIVNCGFQFKDGYWSMKRILAQDTRPTAILFANDATGFGAFLAAKEENISIPDDISIIGFDQLAETMDVAGLLPDLTTMRQPVIEIGVAAGQMLMKRFDSQDRIDPILFPLTLHKGSTVRKLID